MRRFPWSEVTTVLLIASIVAVIMYFDYQAYRLRFPHAPAWTWVFSGGRR